MFAAALPFAAQALGGALGGFLGGDKSMPQVGQAGPPNTNALQRGINSFDFGGLGGAIDKGVQGAVGERAQAFASGKPQPGDAAGLGKWKAQHAAGEFPGTNPWERLAGGAGASASQSAAGSPQQAARTAQQHEDKRQDKQLATTERIAGADRAARLEIAGLQTAGGDLPEQQAAAAAAAASATRQNEQHVFQQTKRVMQQREFAEFELRFQRQFSTPDMLERRVLATINNLEHGSPFRAALLAVQDIARAFREDSVPLDSTWSVAALVAASGLSLNVLRKLFFGGRSSKGGPARHPTDRRVTNAGRVHKHVERRGFNPHPAKDTFWGATNKRGHLTPGQRGLQDRMFSGGGPKHRYPPFRGR